METEHTVGDPGRDSEKDSLNQRNPPKIWNLATRGNKPMAEGTLQERKRAGHSTSARPLLLPLKSYSRPL